MTPVVVEAWHLLVAIAVGAGAVMTPMLRVRTLLRQAADARSVEAVRRERVEQRIQSLETFREQHADACSREHDEIRAAVVRLGDTLGSRLDSMIETNARERGRMSARIDDLSALTGKVQGALEVLINSRSKAAP